MTPEEYVERTGAAAMWLPAAILDLAADVGQKTTRDDVKRVLHGFAPEVIDAVLDALVDEESILERADGVLRPDSRRWGEYEMRIAAGTGLQRASAAAVRARAAGHVRLMSPKEYAARAAHAVFWFPADVYGLVAYDVEEFGGPDLVDLVEWWSDEVCADVILTVVDALLDYGALNRRAAWLSVASPYEPAPAPSLPQIAWRCVRRLGAGAHHLLGAVQDRRAERRRRSG